MGLPPVAQCPRAEVRRAPGRIELRFVGDEREQRFDVDLRLVGEDEDPEAVELALLDRLQELGYCAERLAPARDLRP